MVPWRRVFVAWAPSTGKTDQTYQREFAARPTVSLSVSPFGKPTRNYYMYFLPFLRLVVPPR